MSIDGPTVKEAVACEGVLRSLPRWFGIESAIQDYVRNTERLPTFVIRGDESVHGFVTLERHFPGSWEIHCMAVRIDSRRQGFGRALLAHAEDWVAGQGARWLQVKTLSESASSPEYAETRAFYSRMGFEPFQEFPSLWSLENPCLMMVKAIGTSTDV